MDDHLRGAELARAYFGDLVRPLLDAHFPDLPYAAARLGSGSDVLGFDDATSRDHDWGCRLTLLLDDAGAVPVVSAMLERELPDRYNGRPVRFPVTWDPTVTHKVDIATVDGFCRSRLGVDPSGGPSVLDWLCLVGQCVLEVTAGPVFEDRTSALAGIRAALRRYPPDVERYVLAAWWRRVSQWMPIVGRTAARGDETGSRILGARVAEDLMRLAFALSGEWAPYGKWRGSAFKELPVAKLLAEPLERAVAADGWRERESALAEAAEILLDLQRERGLPAPGKAVVDFWGRPYRTIDEEVAAGLVAGITDPEVAALPPYVGSVEQWVDSVDVLTHADRRAALQVAYRTWIGGG
ncbi:DUF4037 domain-containing protein [Actinomadura verrucosospora]|uniref:DUF4037 domain-containing protein n=1 Tax=Actinomadura verrucosospora TaxID=46165 RepID=A0A7D3VXI0_ACTVE|nr:DUF4037 domain-containing protein [Actinomadura verrucosospora]QKG25793.1 hypothetical protein ACTIVE_7445 [Actinomadura verrucosospora]